MRSAILRVGNAEHPSRCGDPETSDKTLPHETLGGRAKPRVRRLRTGDRADRQTNRHLPSPYTEVHEGYVDTSSVWGL